jgi:hypothetical protein
LIIYTGTSGKTWVARAFSLPPAVFVGQISYSLYLWHWPVFTLLFWPLANFLTNSGYLADPKPWMIRIALIGLAFVLATLSWWYVECPFRKAHGIPRRSLFVGAVITSAVFVVLAYSAIFTNGWQRRFSPESIRLASYVDYKRLEYREGTCFLISSSHYSDYKPDICLNRGATRPNYLLIGDSHAAHLWYGLSQTLNANVMQATASGCKPVLEQPISADERCRKLILNMYYDYLSKNKVDLVIISARWQAPDLGPLARTIDWLRQRHENVVVLGPIVQYQYDLPYILATSLNAHDPQMPERLEIKSFRSLDHDMSVMMMQMHVAYGSVYHALCQNRGCTTIASDGVPVQFDYSHLTAEGSVVVAKYLAHSGVFDIFRGVKSVN